MPPKDPLLLPRLPTCRAQSSRSSSPRRSRCPHCAPSARLSGHIRRIREDRCWQMCRSARSCYAWKGHLCASSSKSHRLARPGRSSKKLKISVTSRIDRAVRLRVSLLLASCPLLVICLHQVCRHLLGRGHSRAGARLGWSLLCHHHVDSSSAPPNFERQCVRNSSWGVKRLPDNCGINQERLLELKSGSGMNFDK